MSRIIVAIAANPVRVMAVLSAVLSLIAFYFPALPVALILAIPAAILGMGETVRAKVTPMSRVLVHQSDVAGMEEPHVAVFDATTLPTTIPDLFPDEA